MQQTPSQSLEIQIPDFVNKFKFMTYNIDQAMREEKYENTKWMNRKDRVAALIRDVDADIVCLQEIRQLPNSITANQFLGQFENYFYEIAYRNPSLASFGHAILYKPSKFYPMKSVKRWLSVTPDRISDSFSTQPVGSTGYGYIVQGIYFVPISEAKVVTNAKGFWVFNTHFGLEEELKTQSCYVLKIAIEDITKGEQFVLSGDFNLFPDRNAIFQRNLLCNWKYQMQDLGKGAKTLKGKPVEGTFIGFDHDEFKADLTNMVSRLDHVFGSMNVIGTDPTLYTKTMLLPEPDELTTRQYPSDHLPLVLELRLNGV